MVCRDVTTLYKLVEDGSCTHAIRERLEREAVDTHVKIGEESETIARLRRTKDKRER